MNFLIIVADDLGWNDVGFNGSDIETPFIDSLAKEGVIMNNFYVQTVCTPTRAAILTGRYPFTFGLERLVWPWSDYGLPTDIKIIPEYLKELNYKTYAIGKWNLGHNKKEFLPTQRGFDHHYGCYCGCQDYYNHNYYNIHDFHENGEPTYPVGHSTDLFTDKACQYIKNHNTSQPFFMYLAFTSPHVPLKCDNYWKNKSFSKEDMRKTFSGLVTQMDYSIGKLVANLKSTGLYEDTLIWFTSDNGGWLGYGGNNGPYKGGKANLNEGGVKAVNFIHHKNLSPSVCSQVAHAVDIAPTIISLAGEKLEKVDMDSLNISFSGVKLEKTDGINLSPHLYPEKEIERDLVLSYSQIKKDVFHGACRYGKWKLIIHNDQIELYNLDEDKYENNNLAAID
ncbi:MAG: arylsulfatase, partial [bacterium]